MTILSSFGKVFRRKAVLVGAVALTAVLGVGGASYALSADQGASTVASAKAPVTSAGQGATSSPSGAAGATTGGARSKRAAKVKSILDRAVHVEAVIAKPGGGYETLDIDRGTVTSISSSSITIQRADAVSVTATITSSTKEPKGAPQTGQQVLLTSTGGNAIGIRPLPAHLGGHGSTSSVNSSSGSSSSKN